MWRITTTTANDMSFSRFNISFINFISVKYLLTKLFELLVHKLGSSKCVVAGISVCSNIYFIKRIARQKKRISLIPPPVTTAEIRPSGNLAEKNWQKMKIPNSGLSVFTSGSTGRIYQLQDRSSCNMRYLHYPTLENTRSFIKIIAKRKKRISLIPPPVTTAEIRPSRNLAEKTDKKWKFQILVSTCSWAAAQAGSTNCKIVVRVECGTFTTLPSRILVALWNYEHICKFYWMTRVCGE